MPPPTWTGTCSPTAATISRITFSFFGRPAIAPLRSTVCRRRAPWVAQCLAISTGLSENTVAVSILPCCRRTQRPSFTSIAGMISTATDQGAGRGSGPSVRGKSGAPADEVGEKLQAGGLALFRVKLDGEDVIPGYGAGKGHTIHATCRAERPIGRRGIVAVHEVEPAAVADAGPQRVCAFLQHLVPAHVRDLERRRREARHAAGEHAERRRIAFLAMLEEHLQAEADAEIGLRGERLEHRIASAARRQVAHALGTRALPRDDDAP